MPFDRRAFLGGAAGLAATAALSSFVRAAAASPQADKGGAFLPAFPSCDDFKALVPVKRIAKGRIIHRFFDTCPISPSGRYAALFRLPNENKPPRPGEAGEVVLVDLVSGRERVIAESRGWEVQMGANVQWSPKDDTLFFNDVDTKTWQPFATMLHVDTGRTTKLNGTVFTISPDGRLFSSHNQITSRRVQVGYGVVLPEEHTPVNRGLVADDGIYVTDIARNERRLIVSMRDIVDKAVPKLAIPNAEKCQFYCFQTRWNPQGTRLMTFLRWIVPGPKAKNAGRTLALITMKTDGSDLRVAVTAEQYARGGHHPMWTPDGEHLILNLRLKEGQGLELVKVRYDNSDMRSLHPVGSGHPSQHARLPFVISDAYPAEPIARGDGTAPLRFIDLRNGKETALAHIPLVRSETKKLTTEHRIDAHPVWGTNGRWVVFNGVVDDTRAVYVADLGPWMEKTLRQM